MTQQSFIVDRSFERMRLDLFLVERLFVFSRSQVQHLIDKGGVLVNGKKPKSNYQVKFTDKITVDIHEVVEQKREPVQSSRPVYGDPKILAETTQYFIIDKPAGWLMHEAEGADPAPLISEYVLEKDPLLSMVGDNPSLRPGIVHRLDKEVSGLIIVARTQGFFDHIKRQFIDREMKKTYQALVFGHPAKEEDAIHFRITRSRRRGRMAAIPVNHPDGKTATTHFEVLERFQHSTLLKIWVESGRTNQIRVHLGAYGLPIVGDTVYGKRTPANLSVGRVMLHADTMSFYDLSGNRVEYSSPLPPEFQQLLDKARKTLTR